MLAPVEVDNETGDKVCKPKGLTYIATLVAGEDYKIDLTLSNARNIIQHIQTLWIDNRAGANALTITMQSSQQVITVAAGDAKYMSVVVPVPIFTLNRADAGRALIIFLNVPIPTSVGGQDFASVIADLLLIYGAIGALTVAKVTDPDAASASSNGLLRGILYALQQSENSIPSLSYVLDASLATTNATRIKGAAGTLKSAQGYNTTAAVKWLHFYNSVANPPIPGTTVAIKSIPLPPMQAFAYDFDFAFSTGIGIAITANAALTDATAIGAGDITGLNVDYI